MALGGNIVRRLGELVGPEHVVGHTVFPGTPEEVAAVLSLANAERLRVIPAGNSSQQDLGGAPAGADLTLCLRRLNRLKQYEPADLTASMEAQASPPDVTTDRLRQAALCQRQRILKRRPLDSPKSGGS